MSDTTIKQVLVKFLFDLSDGAKSVSDFLSSLEDVNTQQQNFAQSSSQQQATTAQNWQALAAQIRAAVATESEGTDEIIAQRQSLAGLLTNQIGLLQQLNDPTKQQLATLKAMTLELERQQSFLKGGPGVTSGTANALSIVTDAMQGLGLGSTGKALASGAAGGGIVLMVQQIAQLAKEIMDLVLASGQLTHVTETFQSLSAAIGAVPVEMLDNLRTATGGLISNMDLMKNANTVLLQGIPLSAAQIVTLTGAVSQLATAQGKDATQAMALMSRGLASGRVSMLAYYLGLQDTVKAQLQLDAQLPNSVKYWAQYQTILAAVNAQNEAIGPQQETVTDSFTHLKVAASDFFESLGQNIAQSAFGAWLTDMANKATSLFGILSGPGLLSITQIQQEFAQLSAAQQKQIVTKATGASGQIDMNAVAALVNQYTQSQQVGGTSVSQQQLASIAAASRSTQQVAPGTTISMDANGNASQLVTPDYDAAKNQANVYYEYVKSQAATEVQQAKQAAAFWLQVNEGAYKNGLESFQDYISKKESIQQDADNIEIASLEKQKAAQVAKYNADNAAQTANLTDQLANAQSSGAGAAVVSPLQQRLNDINQGRVALETTIDNQISAIRAQENMQQLKDAQDETTQERQLRLQALQEQQKDFQSYMQQQEQLAKDAFENGTTNAAQYTAARIVLLQQELSAFQNEKAQEIAIAGGNTQKANALKQQEAAYASQTYEKIAAIQENTANEATQQMKQQYEQVVRYYQDMAAAAATPGLGKILSGGSGAKGSTSNEVQRGYQQQEQQFLQAFTQQMGNLLAVMQQAPDKLQAFIKSIQDLLATADPNSPQAKALTQVLNEAQGVSVSAQGVQNTATQQASGNLSNALNSNDTSAAAIAMDQLQTAISQLGPASTTLSKIFLNLVDEQAEAKKQLDELNNSLDQFKGVIVGVLSVLGAAFSQIGLKDLGSGFEKASQIVQTNIGYSKYADNPGSGEGLSDNSFMGLFQSMGNMFSGQGDMTQNLQDFGKALSTATVNIGSFVNALQGAGGHPATAGLEGAASGFELGSGIAQGVGSALTAAGSSMGSAISSFAPEVGAAIGLVGGIISTFSAKAEAKAQEFAEQMQKDFDNIINSLNSGNSTLENAITQATATEQQTVSTLSGQKGGQTQLNNILPQMQQTIADLQSKQQQIFTSMQETLNSITAPQPYQQMISQINQLIDTYDQYVDAGGSVAIANQFLQSSYENLAQQGLQTLNQDYQNAIQDAINYQNLLQQQAQQTAQYLDQVNNILANGAATRTTTQAMTEMTQLNNLSTQYQQQSEQLNQQIQVTAYRLSVEQQIFNLAQTRVGLESQLVTLQNQQTSQAMAQIVALQQLVATVSSGTPITAMSILLSLLGISVPSVPGIVAAPGSAEAAAPPYNSSTSTAAAQDIEALVLSLYNNYGSQGLGSFYGEQ